MTTLPQTSIRSIAVAVAMSCCANSAAQEQFVAGSQPSKRPEGAPVISEFKKDNDWYQRALRGIDKPYPHSLRFLEDQGAWYTSFTHRGLRGRYDIRGLYEGSTQ